MLNFVYWPISAILWFWHKLLSYVLDPGWGITWVAFNRLADVHHPRVPG